MFCHNCGVKLRDGVRFCNNCGTKIDDDDNDIVYQNIGSQRKFKNDDNLGSIFQKYFINIIMNKYAQFHGRSSRTEYWYYALFNTLITLGLFIVTYIFFGMGGIGMVAFLSLGLLLPSIAIGVRRLHDMNLSGWFMLLALIPYVGGIALLILMSMPSKEYSKY